MINIECRTAFSDGYFIIDKKTKTMFYGTRH